MRQAGRNADIDRRRHRAGVSTGDGGGQQSGRPAERCAASASSEQLSATGAGLEVWGGPECTVNRVGDQYLDQFALGGHDERPEDLDRFAALGLRALRYPVHWERTAPEPGPAALARADWAFADARLRRLRALGVRPIVGLVHHGSGPAHTSLVDPAFPEGLAAFGGAVAARYPWVTDYTPVNEPLTTARFSGLYGHWYPHGRDDRTFIRALLTQCRATVLAMRAIRAVTPAARLIQTEDLGKTWSTPMLAYQAAFENERRWASLDLLCGRVDRHHPLWSYLLEAGASEAELAWFLQNPCPPDVVGVNHYLSSERFLDERLERYPAESHGGNGRHAYADVLASRVLAEGPAGPEALLRETWERYHLPIAVTEAHNGCTREEQLRWLVEVWEAAESLRQEGADIRAVTAWSLLGAHGWNTLATQPNGTYEPGVFDLRGRHPRPTALAGLIRQLADGARPDHPVLDGVAWWRRPERLFYPPVTRDGLDTEAPPPLVPQAAPRLLLIAGATGVVAETLARLCDLRGLPYRQLSGRELDIADPGSVETALAEFRPWAVINAAAFAPVEDTELRTVAYRRQSARDSAVLAAACRRGGVKLLTFSTDLVFDGAKCEPYLESDPTCPLSAFGRRAAEADAAVARAMPSALVVRSGALFGPWDDTTFVTAALRTLAEGRTFAAADDLVSSPTYAPDLVNAALDLLIDGEGGLWHLATPGATTWADLARQAADLAGLDGRLVRGRPARALGRFAQRPTYSVLGSERGVLLPPLEDALLRCCQESQERWREDHGAHVGMVPVSAPVRRTA